MEQVEVAQEQYVDAVYRLIQIVTLGNLELMRLEQRLMREPANQELTAEFFLKKADVIAAYTQRVERGGFN